MEQGPHFSGRGEIYADTVQALVLKAADFLSIARRRETDSSLKKMRERAEELEREKAEQKSEFGAERAQL